MKSWFFSALLPSIKLILGNFLFRSDILVEQSFGSRFSFGPVLPSDRVCLSFVLVYQRMARQRKSRPCDAISHVIWLLRYTSLRWYQAREARFVHPIYPISGKNTSARFASPVQVFLCSGIQIPTRPSSFLSLSSVHLLGTKENEIPCKPCVVSRRRGWRKKISRPIYFPSRGVKILAGINWIRGLCAPPTTTSGLHLNALVARCNGLGKSP
jgi:hypothetical protein